MSAVSPKAKGAVVLAAQLVLVLSVAAKFAWERHVCPMVWTRTYQVDPSLPLRGRYLSLTMTASACGLPNGTEEFQYGLNARHEWAQTPAQGWRVHTIAQNGQLTMVPAPEDDSANAQQALLGKGAPCQEARLQEPIDYFVSDKATVPPLRAGEAMWVLVTVPPSGPPRPVQLAISDGQSFHPLHLR